MKQNTHRYYDLDTLYARNRRFSPRLTNLDCNTQKRTFTGQLKTSVPAGSSKKTSLYAAAFAKKIKLFDKVFDGKGAGIYGWVIFGEITAPS